MHDLNLSVLPVQGIKMAYPDLLLFYCSFRNIIQFNLLGWGRTVGGGGAADTLQQAMLPVAEHSACSRVNGRLVPVDERSMVCAGGQGKGGCQVNKEGYSLGK